jgi:putative flavoprotein involved in K+ transport
MTPARAVDVVVIGAGHNGLAASEALARHGVDHVVLERGEVAHRWRTERWDSLRLLTPTWMTALPGFRPAPGEPDGFLSAAQTADHIAAYAAHLAAPVRCATTVTAVTADGDGYRVETDRGAWRCRGLVLASGAFGTPLVPRIAAQVPAGVTQVTASAYRRPELLPDGGVLVVGASASGLQIARELRASGRAVTLATGEHVRLPRLYRGQDVHRWMEATGLFDARIEDEDDPGRARNLPSPQLAGSDARTTLDLNVLRGDGVEVVGRLAGLRDGRLLFSGGLRNTCALADLKLARLLDAFDIFAAAHGIDAQLGPPVRPLPTLPPEPPRLTAALGPELRSIVWATGYRPQLDWLRLPVFDGNGALRHDRGAVQGAPGVVVLGLPFLRRRKSSFLHGCADDVRELCAVVRQHLRVGPASRSRTVVAAA